MIWLELCTTYSSSSPVVTTTSIILCFNKHRLTRVPANPGSPGKWPLKWRERLQVSKCLPNKNFVDCRCKNIIRTECPSLLSPNCQRQIAEEILYAVFSLFVLTAIFPCQPWLAGCIGTKDDGSGGDNCSYKACKATVKLLPSTNQHPTFYRPDALPVSQQTVSKHWRENFTQCVLKAVRVATQYAHTPLLSQWAPKRLTLPSRPKHSSTFPRWPLQLPDALTRRWVKRPGDLDLLTLKVVSESRVTWATSMRILVFLSVSVLELVPMYATEVRQTDVRQTDVRRQKKASLNAPAY